MNEYLKKVLSPDEKVVKKAEVSLISLVSPFLSAILFVIFFIMCIIMNNEGVDMPVILIVILLFWFFAIVAKLIDVLIHMCCSVLAITQRRVISKKGLLNIQTLDSPLDKINDVIVKQPLFGKIFNYGTLIIKTSSSTYLYEYAEKPQEIANALMTVDRVQKVEVTNNSNQIYLNNKYEELTKLKELLDNNVITQEEFEAEKKKIFETNANN